MKKLKIILFLKEILETLKLKFHLELNIIILQMMNLNIRKIKGILIVKYKLNIRKNISKGGIKINDEIYK
jgi:hypothetical protein